MMTFDLHERLIKFIKKKYGKWKVDVIEMLCSYQSSENASNIYRWTGGSTDVHIARCSVHIEWHWLSTANHINENGRINDDTI